MKEEIKFSRSEKRILWMMAFFAVVILVSQVLQFINHRNNETEYRKMLVSRLIIVETSQQIMIETTAIHRLLLNLLISSSPAEIENFKSELKVLSAPVRQEITTIEKNVFSTGQAEKKSELAQRIEAYEKSCYDFLAMVESDKVKALEYKNNVVRPGFEKIQLAQTDIINTLNNDLQAESDKIAAASTSSSLVILLLGISPFVLIAGYLLFQSSKVIYHELS